MIHISELQTGDIISLVDGCTATVQAPSEDGQWVKVKYVDGTEDLCSAEDLR